MIIRDMEPTDLQAMAETYAENWHLTYPGMVPDELLERITVEAAYPKWAAYTDTPGQHIFVACEGDRFLGFGACKPDDDHPDWIYIDALHVSKDARKIGTGTGLIRRIAQHGIENGFDRMSLCFIKGNDNASNLYKKLGARSLGDYREEYFGFPTNSEKMAWDSLDAFKQR